MTRRHFAYAAEKLLKTVDINVENIKEWAILDSGATSHFLVVDAPVDDVTKADNPINVKQPDGAYVTSTHTCNLKIPNLPHAARLAHLIPGLASHSLVSVVRLCNAGCRVTFTKIDCIVEYRGRTIMRGYKCTKNGLWMVNLRGWEGERPIDAKHMPAIETIAQGLPQTSPNIHPLQDPMQMAANALQTLLETTGPKEMIMNLITTSTQSKLALFYHQVLSSPPKSTLLRAIKNKQLKLFPGLTYDLIKKHLPESCPATEKGHMV